MSLSLKEAFRQMNFLEQTISSLSYYLKDVNNAIKVVEKHLKSKSNMDATDDELDVTTIRTYPEATLVDILYLLKQLIDSKTELTVQIEDAKNDLVLEGTNLTLNAAIEHAKKTRDLANSLKTLVDIKSTETKKVGSGLKFNINLEQVSYKYEILQIKTIDFDRTIVNDNYKKLLEQADVLSTAIESAMLQNIVQFDPLYSIHDSLTDIVEKYIASK